MINNLKQQSMNTVIKLAIFWIVVTFGLVYSYDYHFIKVIHIVAVISWFAGLFYLPRLMVYNVESNNDDTKNTLNIMAYKLFYYIMQPAMFLSVIAGLTLLSMKWDYISEIGYWLHIKITLVGFLIIYHFYLNILRRGLLMNLNVKTSKFYRIINEIPTLILIGVITSIVYKFS